MKKLALLIALCLIASLCACSSNLSYQEQVNRICGLDITGSTVVSGNDSHGGFLGDGALTVEFDCTQISESVVQQMRDWETLPLSENLQLMMYGGTRNGVSYDRYNLAERYSIPEISNGCYFFLDRHSDAVNTKDAANLFDRASYNFSLLLYDFDSARLYLFEFDT